MAAGVAHEINNPLMYVLGNVDLALDQVLEMGERCNAASGDRGDQRALLGELAAELEAVGAALRDARIGAGRVRYIVRDLRIFARGDEENQGPIDVRSAVDTSINMAMSQIRHRARLVKAYEDVPQVMANESRLGQVFLNLIVNAVQAIPEGSVEENELRVATRTDAAGRAVVEISDTGAGIPPEIIGRIFDPFFTTKDVGIGTGLGLSICHGIITSLGGDITVESSLGKGTVFRVLLPPAPSLAVAPVEPPPAARTPASRARVLVVDDEPELGRMLKRIFGDDQTLVMAGCGREALGVLEHDDAFDAILCDIMMPEMSGPGIYEEVLRRQPHLAERFIFMTGGAFTPRARDFLDRVPNPTLEKPIDIDALRSAIEEMCARG
jgi:CheY-like chemotaxis protein